MKQDITTYLVDSFIDFEGKEHKFVACALSQSPENDTHKLKVGWVNEYDVINPTATIYNNIYRMVTIGISICNPEDVFDVNVGKKIAKAKAANMDTLPRIYTTSKGIITDDLVQAFLEQQVKFFKENPETLIAGYKEAKEKYKKLQSAKETIDKFTDEEKAAFSLAVKGFDLSKYSELAKIYIKKIIRNV